MLPDPAALEQSLVRGAAEIGLALTAEQCEQLCRYLDLLLRWNRVYNLTAVRDPESMLRQHVFDCLAIVPSVRRWSGGRSLAVLDVGSGAGLPGLVLAALMAECSVTCIDAVGKKASFIRQAAGELGLHRVQALHARVETLQTQRFDLIASRAFSSLGDFVTLTKPLAAPGGVWLAMKGRSPDGEIVELPDDVGVFHVEHLHIPQLDAERCVVWMRSGSSQVS